MTRQLAEPTWNRASAALSRPPAAADLGELLFNAKLRVPTAAGGIVSRLELIQRAQSSGCRIVGITAPAGYGKSTCWRSGPIVRIAGLLASRLTASTTTRSRLLVLLAVGLHARIDPGRTDLPVDVRGFGTSVLGRGAPRLAAASTRAQYRSCCCWTTSRAAIRRVS